jgi:hypothetical protein
MSTLPVFGRGHAARARVVRGPLHVGGSSTRGLAIATLTSATKRDVFLAVLTGLFSAADVKANLLQRQVREIEPSRIERREAK